jgi:hypothetical protein
MEDIIKLEQNEDTKWRVKVEYLKVPKKEEKSS